LPATSNGGGADGLVDELVGEVVGEVGGRVVLDPLGAVAVEVVLVGAGGVPSTSFARFAARLVPISVCPWCRLKATRFETTRLVLKYGVPSRRTVRSTSRLNLFEDWDRSIGRPIKAVAGRPHSNRRVGMFQEQRKTLPPACRPPKERIHLAGDSDNLIRVPDVRIPRCGPVFERLLVSL
jgi:hypothetical protein